MTSSIFGLFEVGFAIGFFLPSLLFVVASITIGNNFEVLPEFLNFSLGDQVSFLYATTVTVLISWLCGILLLAINRDIIRLMEGYGRINPLKIFKFLEENYYKRTYSKYQKLYDANQDSSKYRRILSQRFPHKESFILPTAFGNIIRSFETYSRKMYGFDAIPGWDRISFLISKENRRILDSAKSILDFWVNIWVLCIVFIVEYFWIAFSSNKCVQSWRFDLSASCIDIFYVILIGFLLFIATSRAKSAAFLWGNLIKSAVDIYLPELRKKLGFKKPSSREEEREMWKQYGNAIIFRDPDFLPEKENESGTDADIDKS